MSESGTPKRRQRRTPGQFVEVPIGSDNRAFARVLREPLIAFYDFHVASDEQPSLAVIARKPIAFTVMVMNYAVTGGRWPVIGSMPLSGPLTKNPSFWKQDPLTGSLAIYCEDLSPPSYERPATRAECAGLECAAVWDPEHLEARLRDHFAGRPNNWLEALEIK
jgi:hypothetical protein